MFPELWPGERAVRGGSVWEDLQVSTVDVEKKAVFVFWISVFNAG